MRGWEKNVGEDQEGDDGSLDWGVTMTVVKHERI